MKRKILACIGLSHKFGTIQIAAGVWYLERMAFEAPVHPYQFNDSGVPSTLQTGQLED